MRYPSKRKIKKKSKATYVRSTQGPFNVYDTKNNYRRKDIYFKNRKLWILHKGRYYRVYLTVNGKKYVKSKSVRF